MCSGSFHAHVPSEFPRIGISGSPVPENGSSRELGE
jgi:hypothetical protein